MEWDPNTQVISNYRFNNVENYCWWLATRGHYKLVFSAGHTVFCQPKLQWICCNYLNFIPYLVKRPTHMHLQDTYIHITVRVRTCAWRHTELVISGECIPLSSSCSILSRLSCPYTSNLITIHMMLHIHVLKQQSSRYVRRYCNETENALWSKSSPNELCSTHGHTPEANQHKT